MATALSTALTLPVLHPHDACARPPTPACTCPHQALPQCRADNSKEAVAGGSTAQFVDLYEVGGLFVIHVGFLVLSLLVYWRSRCVSGCVFRGGGGGVRA